MFSVTCIVIALMALLINYYWHNTRYIKMAWKVPSLSGRLPFIGHLHMLLGRIDQLWIVAQKIAIEIAEKGGVLTLWAGPIPIFAINDPEDAMTVLNSCLEKGYHYDFTADWLGKVLIIADVPTWKRNRKLLNPTFSQHVLEEFLSVFNQRARVLTKELEKMAGRGEFDPMEVFTETMLEAVCQTAVGVSIDDKSFIDQNYKKAVEKLLKTIAQRMTRFWLHPRFFFEMSSVKRNMSDALAIVHKMSTTVIQKRRIEREQMKEAKTSPRRCIAFLDLLLDMADEGLISDEQTQQELDNLIAAGHDTTARTLLSAAVFLGSCPDKQEKVYKEIKSVLGSSTDVRKEDLSQLVYTEAVIKESLRISPVFPFISRKLDRDVKLRNCTLPAGSECGIFIWGLHRLAIWGPDREEFKPERWLDPETLPKSPGAFCAFSNGKRNCIGKPYAMLLMKTMLVHIVRQYRITADYSKVKRTFDLLLRYVEGQHISLELRK